MPATATEAFIRWGNGSQSATDLVYWDALLLEPGDQLGDYFDGDSPNARWTGTPGASRSLQYAINL